MTYDQFVQVMKDKVREGVGQSVTVHVHTATKNNGYQRKGLMMAEEGINIAPTIYLEEYYRQFQAGCAADDIAGAILQLYEEVRFQQPWEETCIQDFEQVQDRIIYHLVNRKKNKKLLETVPYETYLDMAVLFYVLLEINSCGTATMLIKNEHLHKWGVSREEVYQKACENTEKRLPCEFMTMKAVIAELSQNPEDEEEDGLYVLGNHIRSFGAAAILYENQLKRIGDYLKEDYYVLPSSVHEMLILPESAAPGKAPLIEIVKEINRTQVEEEEILSNHVYYYDRVAEKLMQ